MAYNTSRRARERRLRARYRKKIWTAAIVMLIIGLIAGFVVCVFAAKNNDRVGELLNLQQRQTSQVDVSPTPEADLSTTPESLDAQPTDGADDSQPSLEILQISEAPVSAETQAPNEVPVMASFLEDDEAGAAEEPDVDSEAVETVQPEAEVTQGPVDVLSVEPEATQIIEEAATPEATVEPTPEVTAEPTPVPTPENIVEPVFVSYGEAQTFQTQILADGTPRRVADEAPYETLDFTIQVKAYKDTAYFEENYADSYKLQGNEAAVEFEITLNNYAGTTKIVPQDALVITFSGTQEGVTSQGFQLMDFEIAGKTDIAITSNEPITLYKRYPYNPDEGDMAYMVVNTYMDGVEYSYCFDIQPPQTEQSESAENGESGESGTESSGESLTVGSTGEEVKKLQQVLIDNKLLYGQPDGKFGNYTAEAVKEMQRRFDMEPTGVADQAFLDRLYESAE